VAAAQIRRRAIREQLVATLDEWMRVRKAAGGNWEQLAAVTRLADDDPWRNRLRALRPPLERQALEDLVEEARQTDLPPNTLTLLGWLLVEHQPQLILGLLEPVQWRYPRELDLQLILGRGYHHAQQYRQAVRCHAAAWTLRPNIVNAYYLTEALDMAGDPDAALALARLGHQAEPAYWRLTAELGSLLEAKGYTEEALTFQREVVQKAPTAGNYMLLGVALLAKGALAEAEAALKKAVQLKEQLGLAHYYLGHVLLQQGRFAEAKARFCRSRDLGLPKHIALIPPQHCIATLDSWQELERQLPAVLGGEVPPEGARQKQLAEVCRLHGHVLASARLSLRALGPSPEPGAGGLDPSLFNAAQAAIAAGCGQGDAGDLDESERAHWRQQGRQWLQAELNQWRAFLDSPTRSAFPAEKALRKRLYQVDLAPVRDADALARLPATEQETWRRYWADLDALLVRFQKQP
jgi:tetratricopeptide (TPR) repeat protein